MRTGDEVRDSKPIRLASWVIKPFIFLPKSLNALWSDVEINLGKTLFRFVGTTPHK